VSSEGEGEEEGEEEESVGSNQNRTLNSSSPRSTESIQMLYRSTPRQGTSDSPASPDPEPFVAQASNSIRNIAEMMGWIPATDGAARTRLHPTPPPTYEEAVIDGASIYNNNLPVQSVNSNNRASWDVPVDELHQWAEGELEAILALPSSNLPVNTVAADPVLPAAPAPVAVAAPIPVAVAAPVPVAVAAPVPVAAVVPAPSVAPLQPRPPTAIVPVLPAAGEELPTRPLPDYLPGAISFFLADRLLSERPHTTEEQFREVINSMDPPATVGQLVHLQERMWLNRQVRGVDPEAAAAATLVLLGRRPMLTVLPVPVLPAAAAPAAMPVPIRAANENDDIG
jgi:hypothetical protein